MKHTPVNTRTKLTALGLVITLCALPLLLGVTGCTTTGNEYQQSTGQRIDDNSTSARVRDALSDDTEYKYGNVKVTTFKGTVQLSGFVNSPDHKSRAGELTRNVEGVHYVVNNITVREPENRLGATSGTLPQ